MVAMNVMPQPHHPGQKAAFSCDDPGAATLGDQVSEFEHLCKTPIGAVHTSLVGGNVGFPSN